MSKHIIIERNNGGKKTSKVGNIKTTDEIKALWGNEELFISNCCPGTPVRRQVTVDENLCKEPGEGG